MISTSDRTTQTRPTATGRPLSHRDGRSIADLLKELRDESRTLFRQEVALAKTELSEKAAKAGRNVAYLGGGALIGYAGLVFVLLGVSHLLTVGLSAAGVPAEHALWLGPLIVGAVVAAVGGWLAYKAIQALRQPDEFVPRMTVDSLQENTRWARQKLS